MEMKNERMKEEPPNSLSVNDWIQVMIITPAHLSLSRVCLRASSSANALAFALVGARAHDRSPWVIAQAERLGSLVTVVSCRGSDQTSKRAS
jgi:hypothetical protein